MATTSADVIRVNDTQANLLTTLRAGQWGNATDTKCVVIRDTIPSVSGFTSACTAGSEFTYTSAITFEDQISVSAIHALGENQDINIDAIGSATGVSITTDGSNSDINLITYFGGNSDITLSADGDLNFKSDVDINLTANNGSIDLTASDYINVESTSGVKINTGSDANPTVIGADYAGSSTLIQSNSGSIIFNGSLAIDTDTETISIECSKLDMQTDPNSNKIVLDNDGSITISASDKPIDILEDGTGDITINSDSGEIILDGNHVDFRLGVKVEGVDAYTSATALISGITALNIQEGIIVGVS